ncbi:hypothetical protein Tco_1097324, partial [Tanacetum coccineum]
LLDLTLVVSISTVLVLVPTILIVGLVVVLHGRKTGWSDLVRHRFEICCSCLRDVFLDVISRELELEMSACREVELEYNALNINDQDSLNPAAGGNFLDKMPRECLKIIESKSKVRQTRAKAVVAKVSTNSSTQAVSSDVAELKDIVRALLLDKKNQQPFFLCVNK